MVNIEDFIKRLEIILDYYGLNASSFADKIGVQRSSMSHLLSGRNKPSLDFVMKIMEVYPDVDLYWILNGIGDFPKKDDNIIRQKVNISENKKVIDPLLSDVNFTEQNLFSKIDVEEKSDLIKMDNEIKKSSNQQGESEIEKIVVFYKNGTFKLYTY